MVELGKQLFGSICASAAKDVKPLVGCAGKKTFKIFVDVLMQCLYKQEMSISATTEDWESIIYDAETIKLKCVGCMQHIILWWKFGSFDFGFPHGRVFDKWKRSLCVTPQLALKEAWETLESVAGVNLRQYMVERGVPTDYFDGDCRVMDEVCHWDHFTVWRLVEMLQHMKHDEADKTIVCYSDSVTLDQFDSEMKQFKIPSHVTCVICLAYLEKQHAVFDIRIPSRQVVVYDGYDGTPQLLGKTKDNFLLDTLEDHYDPSDRFWWEYAQKLLRAFSLFQEASIDLEIGCNDFGIIRDENSVCSADATWQIVSPVLLYKNDWWHRLIRQFDTHSSGKIAVLHAKKLLGYPVEIEYCDNKESYIPNRDSLSVDSLIPNLKKAIGKWLQENMEYKDAKNGVQDLLAFYCEDYCQAKQAQGTQAPVQVRFSQPIGMPSKDTCQADASCAVRNVPQGVAKANVDPGEVNAPKKRTALQLYLARASMPDSSDDEPATDNPEDRNVRWAVQPKVEFGHWFLTRKIALFQQLSSNVLEYVSLFRVMT